MASRQGTSRCRDPAILYQKLFVHMVYPKLCRVLYIEALQVHNVVKAFFKSYVFDF